MKFALVWAFLVSTVWGAGIAPENAGEHVGEEVVVTGRVVQVSRLESGRTFLNFGARHPNSVFTAVIHPNTAGFGDMKTWEGQEVEVRGKVLLHKGRPQIELRSPAQLRRAGEVTPSGNETGASDPLPEPSSPLLQEENEAPSATIGPPPAVEPPGPAAPLSGVLSGARPGWVHQFKVPLTPDEQKKAGQGPGGVVPDEATVGVVIPEGFDPARPQKVLVVFSTDDNGGAHVGALGRFGPIAARHGWLALAANGPVLDKSVAPEWHAIMVLAGLRALEEEWPGLREWPMFTGGNSGGASRASMIACGLLKAGYPIRGVFMGSTGGERFRAGMEIFNVPKSEIRPLRGFLAFGKNDRLLSDAARKSMESALEAAGIKTLRRVEYEGGHGLEPATLVEGLDWLASENP